MITEIDGPPRGHFSLTDGNATVHFRARTIHFQCDSPEHAEEMIKVIQTALIRSLPEEDAIILWRQRLKYEADNGVLYGRLATSPPVPESFWDRFGRPEGTPPRIWE